MTTTIGIIADTHGLLRPEACRALEGCHTILHAGDIGGPELLEALAALAPVVAVRGNNDRGAWADELPTDVTVEVEGRRLHVVHDVHDFALDPGDKLDAVISGHSHRPSVERRDGVLFLNPGAAGPRRFRLPVAVATLELREDGLDPRIVRLDELLERSPR